MKKYKCHCGEFHSYSTPQMELMCESIIDKSGDTVQVRVTNKEDVYLVPKRYIIWHGIKAWEVPSLGFPKLAGDN